MSKSVILNEKQFQGFLRWTLVEEIASQFQDNINMFINEILIGEIDLDDMFDINGIYGSTILKDGILLSDVFNDIKMYFFDKWLLRNGIDYNASSTQFKIHERSLWDGLNKNWDELIKPFIKGAKEGKDIQKTNESINRNFYNF